MRNFDMDLLRALVAVVDQQSFSLAAQRLGRTQSAISLQIKRLEELAGRQLLHRVQGRVEGPTADGRVLVDYARRILRLNDEAYDCFDERQGPGQLRIGLPEELMESGFPQVLMAMRSLYPRLELYLRCDLSITLQQAVDNGELELAVFKRVRGNENAPLNGNERVLWHEPLVWMCSERDSPEERRPLPLGLYQDGCVFRAAALATLARHGLPWQIVFSGHSYTGLRHAVTAGLAVTPQPRRLLAPGMRIVHDLPALPDMEIAVKFAKGDILPAALRLTDLLQEHLWAEPAGAEAAKAA
jgi:DNA-binding transcriptional LysR family regulator